MFGCTRLINLNLFAEIKMILYYLLLLRLNKNYSDWLNTNKRHVYTSMIVIIEKIISMKHKNKKTLVKNNIILFVIIKVSYLKSTFLTK
jgi:hypothetical protein